MLRETMNAEQALADLTEISSQVQAAVIFDDTGKIAGSTFEDARTDALASAAGEILRIGDGVRPGATVTQVEVATHEGSVFVVREGETNIAATTSGNPTVGLVFYDLKSTLRNMRSTPARKAAATKPKKTAPAGAKKKTAARKPAAKKKTDAS
jgi:predicted regulator of Ras-like GTPase activity (Roadblock/LC7/MglB family)